MTDLQRLNDFQRRQKYDKLVASIQGHFWGISASESVMSEKTLLN